MQNSFLAYSIEYATLMRFKVVFMACTILSSRLLDCGMYSATRFDLVTTSFKERSRSKTERRVHYR